MVSSGALLSLSALLVVLFSAVLIQQLNGASLAEFQADEKDPNYWPKRREWFYQRTAFNLTDDNLRLLGPKRLMGQNKSAQPRGHLPFWFDYELFKKVYNKRSNNDEEERARHKAYINTCIRVLKARVLFRMLAGTSDTFITKDADRFHWEIFGPMQTTDGQNSDTDISFSVDTRIETPQSQQEDPLDRAIRLVRREMEIVESRNQVETNLKAFDEIDGSAIKDKLPY